MLNLVVLRVTDLKRSQRFYESLGLTFAVEQHGSSPEHLAASAGGSVFELYPRGQRPASADLRLGFRVASVADAVVALQQLGAEVAVPPSDSPRGYRAVVVDPDGHRVELTQ